MASRTISNLPASSGFRITVKVTADGVEIGTINIVRKGDPATIEAGIYPFDYCVNTGADDALATDDTLNLKGDDCAMDMLRYGRERDVRRGRHGEGRPGQLPQRRDRHRGD